MLNHSSSFYRVVGIGIAIVFSACSADREHGGVMSTGPEFLDQPDLSYRLSESEIRQLHPTLDAAILQEFLQWLSPESRAEFLEFPVTPGDQKVSLGHITMDPPVRPEVAAVLDRLNAAMDQR